DALFAFGPQTIGEQGEVELPAEESAFGAGGGHGCQLVGQDRLRIMEQPAHQGGFAVIDGPGGGEAQQRLRPGRRIRLVWGGRHGSRRSLWCRHQKYPSFFRSSMAAAEIRSSARVAPRSVTVVAA